MEFYYDSLSANSPVVRILAFQASGPGSIPGWRKLLRFFVFYRTYSYSQYEMRFQILEIIYVFSRIPPSSSGILCAPIVQWLGYLPSKQVARVRFPVGAKGGESKALSHPPASIAQLVRACGC
jgi:hypothetical protein